MLNSMYCKEIYQSPFLSNIAWLTKKAYTPHQVIKFDLLCTLGVKVCNYQMHTSISLYLRPPAPSPNLPHSFSSPIWHLKRWEGTWLSLCTKQLSWQSIERSTHRGINGVLVSSFVVPWAPVIVHLRGRLCCIKMESVWWLTHAAFHLPSIDSLSRLLGFTYCMNIFVNRGAFNIIAFSFAINVVFRAFS